MVDETTSSVTPVEHTIADFARGAKVPEITTGLELFKGEDYNATTIVAAQARGNILEVFEPFTEAEPTTNAAD